MCSFSPLIILKTKSERIDTLKNN